MSKWLVILTVAGIVSGGVIPGTTVTRTVVNQHVATPIQRPTAVAPTVTTNLGGFAPLTGFGIGFLGGPYALGLGGNNHLGSYSYHHQQQQHGPQAFSALATSLSHQLGHHQPQHHNHHHNHNLHNLHHNLHNLHHQTHHTTQVSRITPVNPLSQFGQLNLGHYHHNQHAGHHHNHLANQAGGQQLGQLSQLTHVLPARSVVSHASHAYAIPAGYYGGLMTYPQVISSRVASNALHIPGHAADAYRGYYGGYFPGTVGYGTSYRFFH